MNILGKMESSGNSLLDGKIPAQPSERVRESILMIT